ncbi:MAG: FliI/YscN family ATPase, partial [Planctomycetales bacterium]|nr:FliI/YscN family ATPase [Planctomycetales bacterium]
MLRLNVDDLKQEIAHFDVFRTAGRLRSAQGIVRARLRTAVGDMCHILRSDGRTVPGEVIGFDGATAQIMPYETTDGLEPDATVVGMGRKLRIPVGRELLGRIINALGRPIDGGHLRARQWSTIQTGTPSPLERPPIETPFVTGQRVIDGLLTLGKGQRVGLFAGSGVGKSTLLGEIAKSASSDLNVIALVGERGREVRPFLEECLGPEGLARSVVIVSTADQPPLLRIRATQTAVTIADHFRSHGADVLLLVDSLTRLAMAQREIGLLMGEPPSARGYTPSVFQMLSNVLEQLGTSAHGSITGICTVLVDGDDMDEPVADNVRAVVDGHIVLSRRLAERGHYPAVDVGASVSRTFREVTDPQHQSAARKVRAAL